MWISVKLKSISMNCINEDIVKIKSVLINRGIAVKSVKLFEEGTLRDTFKIIAESTDYVVKLFDSSAIGRVKFEIENLRKISNVTDLAICPLNAEPLIFGDRVGYYYEFFDGKMLNQGHINNLHYRFGTMVGEFDNALKTLSFNQQQHARGLIEYMAKINRLPVDIAHDNNTLCLIKKGLVKINKEWNRMDISNLRIQFIHKDLHFNNVIYNEKNNKFFIVDTAGLSVQFLAKEISVIIGNEFVSGDVINFQIVSAIIGGYSKHVLLNKNEIKAIPLFIIEKKIGELNFIQEQFNNRYLSLQMYEKYKKLSSNNLRKIIENYDLIVDFLSKCHREVKK